MKLHKLWMFKAENDLRSAQKLNEGNEPILDTAVYHAQQCAEKSLKAYLAFTNQPITKTHDLVALNDKCVKISKDFDLIYDLIEPLNQLDTFFRYPSDSIVLEPAKEEVDIAIKNAKEVHSFVLKKIIKEQ